MITNKIETTDEERFSRQDERIVQNYILVWLDRNINQIYVDYQNTVSKFKNIVNTIILFDNRDECLDFVTDVGDVKIFMILSDNLPEYLVTCIHSLSNIAAIYIFHSNNSNTENWLFGVRSKVKGFFTNLEPIYELMQHAARQSDRDSIEICFLQLAEKEFSENLNELHYSFMYTRLLKEILLDFEYNEQSMKELINYCRILYSNNDRQLDIIDELERDYQTKTPIWWYTRECFLYSMLNRALRKQEVEIIIKMGFFLKDLHQKLRELQYEQNIARDTPTFTVYRGQGMSLTDFEKLQKSKGCLISFNNFLSTSTDRILSHAFADSYHDDYTAVGIFFEINIDTNISTTPFANIKELSFIKNENEVLFSMHTVFRVRDVKSIEENNRIWQVDLDSTADDDEMLAKLTDYMRVETRGSNGWYRLGRLLIKLGQFRKAEQLYSTLLESELSDEKKASLYQLLGHTKYFQGEYNEAIDYHEKALDIFMRIRPSNDLITATAYGYIGLIYDNVGQYQKALAFLETSLEILQKILPKDHSNLGTLYNNIATVFRNMGQYSKALTFYQNSLEFSENELPSNHPDLATSYNNIASVFKSMGQYAKAIQFYTNSFSIYQKILPSDHPDLAISYCNVGLMHEKIGEYTKALHCFETSLEIRQKSLPQNHPDTASSYNSIAMVYDALGQYSKGLIFYQKSLDIWKTILPRHHPDLANVYNNIGLVYENMDDCSNALSAYEKSLEIRQKILPLHHPDLAQSYNNLACMYDKLRNYPKAIAYYEKSFDIWQKTLPENHPDLAISYNNIAMAYNSLGDHSKAISFCQKAQKIWEETLPPDHPDLAAVYNNIATAYNKVAEYSSALKYFEKSLEIWQKTLPVHHPHVITSYSNIAMLYSNMGECSKSLSFHKKILEIRQNTLDPDHPDIAKSHSNIGLIYNNMEEHTKALSSFERALEIHQKMPSETHLDLAMTLNNIAMLHDNLADHSKALSFSERAVDIAHRFLAPNDPVAEFLSENLEFLRTKT